MIVRVSIDGKSYAVEIKDIHARPVIAEVDGQRCEVWPDEAPQDGSAAQAAVALTAQAAPAPQTSAARTSAGALDVCAPLPGVIVSVDVKVGDQVAVGQLLCTLEAMKMKNAITAARACSIAAVHISAGDQVRHGQLMFTYQE